MTWNDLNEKQLEMSLQKMDAVAKGSWSEKSDEKLHIEGRHV